MGHCKGKDNVRKRKVRRKKAERLALANQKNKPKAAAKHRNTKEKPVLASSGDVMPMTISSPTIETSVA